MNMLKRLLLKIIFIAAGLFIPVILVEIILRIPYINSDYKLSAFKKEDPRCETLNDNYNIFRPSDILGYEHIPNTIPDSERPIKAPYINSYGMVGKEYKLEKEENTYRILVLGDSITEFHWYVEYLENELNSDKRFKYDFELWNAGVCGYEVNQYLNFLKYNGLKYKPDMLIIGFCLNDFNKDEMVVFYKDKKDFVQYHYKTPYLDRIFVHNRLLFRYSYLYRFLIVNFEKHLSSKYVENRCVDSRHKIGIYYMQEIKNICANNNISLVCAVFPYLKPLSEYTSDQMKEYNHMFNVLKELKIGYVDLHKCFPESKRNFLRNDTDDCVHPSREGHRIAANEIYNYIIKNNLIDISN